MAQKSIGAFTAAGGIPPVRQQFDKEFLKQMSPSILLTVDLSNSFLFDFAGSPLQILSAPSDPGLALGHRRLYLLVAP